MIVSAIVAVAENHVIGYNNRIPWHLPADLKFFKRTTLHHHIIMGRKTFLSIGKPLPQRTNIIVTSNPAFSAAGIWIAHSIAQALNMAKAHGETEAFIIGGSQIFQQSMHWWHRLYLTEVKANPQGDIWLPPIDFSQWHLIQSEAHKADEKNQYDYCFKIFERRQPPLSDWEETPS